MRASMSRRGNCYANAPIESFWGSLKSELVDHQRFATREKATLAISEYIEMFYNWQRTHARPDYLSSVAFTLRFYLNHTAAQSVGVHGFRPTSSGCDVIYAGFWQITPYHPKPRYVSYPGVTANETIVPSVSR